MGPTQKRTNTVQDYIKTAISTHKLPDTFSQTVSRWYIPIAQEVAARAQTSAVPYILGVQGTQGSGKSTLADFLRLILENEFQLPTVSLSIDDFYLTHKARKNLGKTVHPLLATRGVPGTHDTELALNTIHQLQNPTSSGVLVPRFNKAIDDRAPKSEWDNITTPVKVIILEGWCVGVSPQPASALAAPINDLEAQEDSSAQWRQYVNQQLSEKYTPLFEALHGLVVLTAPSFNCVYNWRLLQEQKLAQKWLKQKLQPPAKIQTPEQIKRFISHYQRLTEHALTSLPAVADWQLVLEENHEISALNRNNKVNKNE